MARDTSIKPGKAGNPNEKSAGSVGCKCFSHFHADSPRFPTRHLPRGIL